METETEDIHVLILKETDKAYLFIPAAADGVVEGDWFPKSEVSFKRKSAYTGVAIANIPVWLLEKKGW